MSEIGLPLPARSSSKRVKSSTSSRETPRTGDRDRTTKPSQSPPSSSTSRPARPNAPGRTTSAPLLPSVNDPTASYGENGPDVYDQPRMSLASVKDDPFFRNYQTPQLQALAQEQATTTYLDDLQNEGIPKEPPPRSPRRPSETTSVQLPPQSRSGMADINIAVIGSSGVGKSTLTQRALSLPSLPTSVASSQRMPVDNVVYTVSLIELDLESFDIVHNDAIHWPKQIGGHLVPRMDGALLLYDVMNRESISELPPTLSGLVNSGLPTILVSCKCDNPEKTRQIDVASMEEACGGHVDTVKFASNVPESARLCLNSILKAIMAHRNAPTISKEAPPGNRRRATSSAILDKAADAGTSRPLSEHSKHSRASSDYSLLRGFPAPPPQSSRGPLPASRANGRTNLHHQYSLPDPIEAPPLSSHPIFKYDSSSKSGPDSSSRLNPNTRARSPLPSPGSGRTLDNSFLDMEESDADSAYRYSDDIPILQRNDDGFFDKPAKVAGVTFGELVDRLLDQNMSRADNNFVDIFLCLYRKFAAPGELFGAIISRLESIADDRNAHYLTRTASQLRIANVIAKWVSSYPGDFASPSTSQRLNSFIQELASEPVFAAAAQDMRMQLHSRVVVDDDTGWARTDADVELESGIVSTPVSPLHRKTNPRGDFEDDMRLLRMDGGSGEDDSRDSMADSTLARSDSSSQSISTSFHTVEDYEREAAKMVPKEHLPLNKFRYHIFMDLPDDDLADEMTRIDWVMFSSIRLRDLVRHVSLSLEAKEKCRSLASVNRMIHHFNHIAKWVANMILIREKAKHRALMLEKFMTVALKLRKLNNYNGLAAVLAGINGSAVHRLSQTRALVPVDVQKSFARLVLLMGTQKSHFAYRLAWENSSLPRIPFIPLHRRDLVSAEEGSRTFVGANGDRINWKKFEVLAEVILPIMKSQVVPYPNLKKHEIARELILDCKMEADDEEVYQRSLQLESSSAAAEFSKKLFPWFQKDK